jgi:hypothetical protein
MRSFLPLMAVAIATMLGGRPVWAETALLLHAVGLALTGSDDAEPRVTGNRIDCVFAIKNDVYHNAAGDPRKDSAPPRPTECPLSGVKRMSVGISQMSAYDPKRTCSVPFDHLVGRELDPRGLRVVAMIC